MISFKITPSEQQENIDSEKLMSSFHNMIDKDKLKKECFGYELHAHNGRVNCYVVLPESLREAGLSEIRRSLGDADIKMDVDSSFSTINDKERFVSKWFHLYHLENKNHSVLPLSLKPMNVLPNLMSTFEKLESDEFIIYQTLFAPIRDEEWKETFEDKLERYKKGEADIASETGTIITQFISSLVTMLLKALKDMVSSMNEGEEEKGFVNKRILSNVEKKLKQNGYKNVTRIGVYTPVKKKRKLFTGEMEKAFRLVHGDNGLVITPARMKKRTTKQLVNRKMPTIRFKGQVITESEAHNMMPFGTKEVEHDWIKRVSIKEREVDERLAKKGFLMGHVMREGNRIPVNLDASDLDDVCRVFMSIASPGWGKSTMAESMFCQYAKAGHSIFLFDTTSGNLAKRCIELCPKEREDDLIVLDSINDDVIFNMSALGSTDEEISEAFLELFEFAFNTENMHRSSSYLAKLAIAVFSEPNSTLLELEKFLDSEEFREEHLEHVKKKNPMIYMWWKEEYPKLRSRVIDIFLPIATRLQLLTSTKKMQNMLCSEGGKIDPYKMMNSGKIVVVNLGEKFKEPQMRLIMSLWNYAIWNATLRRGELLRNNEEPIPCHLFYDEPQNYMTATPMFDRAISKARKYRVSPKFYIQNAEQIIEQNPSLWKNIVAMNPHLTIGAVSDEMAGRIAKDVNMSKEEILAVKQQQYHWVLRTFSKKQEVPSVIFKNYQPEEFFEMSHKPEAIERSRRIYAPYSSSYLQEQIGARRFNLTAEQYREKLFGAPEQPIEEAKGEDTNTWEPLEKEEAKETISPLLTTT